MHDLPHDVAEGGVRGLARTRACSINPWAAGSSISFGGRAPHVRCVTPPRGPSARVVNRPKSRNGPHSVFSFTAPSEVPAARGRHVYSTLRVMCTVRYVPAACPAARRPSSTAVLGTARARSATAGKKRAAGHPWGRTPAASRGRGHRTARPSTRCR